VGKKSNRDAIGAKVTLKAGKMKATRMVRAASSYASQSEMILTFGLGPLAPAASSPPIEVEVTWPTGKQQRFPGLAPGRLYTLEEAP
jgi:hypothetical protein